MDILHSVLLYPLEYVMGLCFNNAYRLTGSYGTSVVILSLAVNIVLLPLYYYAERWKFQERAIRQKMEWELASIQRHSKGREKHYYTQEVYRRFGYHPISSVKVSVGFLIQVPFFFAAYQLLSGFPDWQGAAFLLFDDLGAPDGLVHLPGFSLNILPFAMTGINVASAHIYTERMNRSERVQLWLLALFFFLILYGSPAGLVLYWTMNNVVSLAKNIAGQKLNLRFLSMRMADGDTGVADDNRTALAGWTRFRAKLIRCTRLPLSVNVILFLAAVYLLSTYRRGAEFSMHAASASIMILAFICLAPLRQTLRPAEWCLRHTLHVALVWILFTCFLLFAAAWLLDVQPFGSSYTPFRIVVAVLFALCVLLFGPKLCAGTRTLAKVPDRHGLYTSAVSLTAFFVCIANPLTLYTTSEDYSGDVYLAGCQLLAYFLVVLAVAMTLYALVDDEYRRALTLTSVFVSVGVITYSGLLNTRLMDIGLMDHFILNNPGRLSVSLSEFLAEVAFLAALLAASAVITIRYRRPVEWVIGTVLATATIAAGATVYQATDDGSEGMHGSEKLRHELPDDGDAVMSFSRERNVLIIVLDAFPGGYMERIQNKAPHALQEYDGFVWYPNVLTSSSSTWGSIAPLVGGHRYTVQEINRRQVPSLANAITEAYAVYPDAFIRMGYEITYVNPPYSGGCHRIDRRVQCVKTAPYGVYYRSKYENTRMDDVGINVPLLLTMTSLFKAAPFMLKARIYDDGNWLGANRGKFMTAYEYKLRDWGFLSVLARESNADSKSKTFKFIQLSIPHPPNALNDECRLHPETAGFFPETVCSLKAIGVLLERLKQTGAYDSTKIVVVSDHGWWVGNPMFPPDFSKTVPEGYRRRASAGFIHGLLLVKDFDARGGMRRSDTFLSNADVPSIVCSTVGSCANVLPDPIENSVDDRVLTLSITEYPSRMDRTSKFDVKESYEVRNSIFDARNWKRIE